LTSREWLAASVGARCPDFVPQVVEMFDSPRAGDVVVFADGDWTFDARWPGGHGSCLTRDMRIPLYFAGPSLPAGGRIDCGRLVDVMPTILELLGRNAQLANVPAIDGVSLLTELRHAHR
jgi:arylsulfatase A-like enzyme